MGNYGSKLAHNCLTTLIFFRQPLRAAEHRPRPRQRRRRPLQRSAASVVVVVVADVVRVVVLLRVGVGKKTFGRFPARRHLPALLQDLRPLDPLLRAQLLVPGDPEPRCRGTDRSRRLPVRYEVKKQLPAQKIIPSPFNQMTCLKLRLLRKKI